MGSLPVCGTVVTSSNSPRVEPVPCPMTGASTKNRSDFFQYSSRIPIDVGSSFSLYR
jgi:hypothetical protein